MMASDIRELSNGDLAESLRSLLDGARKGHSGILPVVVSENSSDGHTAQLQVAIKGAVTEQSGETTFQDYPLLDLVPITHPGGGGIVHTFAVSKGDEGIALFGDVGIDSWWNAGGTNNNPIDTRRHAMSDGMYLHQHRSNPRKLQQVSTGSAQLRSDDKKHVHEIHPQNGFHTKTVDPSTAAASGNFDPFTQATTFFEQIVHPSNGHALNAIANGITHSFSNTHSGGPLMSAANGAHTVNAHPENGVGIASTVAHTIQAPNATLDKPGNFHAQQNVTAGQNISASGSISAGGGMSIGGLLMSALSGIMQFASSISSSGTVSAATLETTLYTVATLNSSYPPSILTKGMRAAVTDASAPSFLAALAGGGAICCPAFCNGTVWVAG